MSDPANAGHAAAPALGRVDRRDAVLAAALATFARFGYRKTSMEDVARAAAISRPGLYHLFASKAGLFRAAVTRTLELDLAEIERLLAEPEPPLRERLLAAFDQWAGRYVGPLTGDVATVIDDHPGLLGEVRETAPRRFEALVTEALAAHLPRARAIDTARTLISASIGIKRQVQRPDDYRERMGVALRVVLP